LSLLDIAALRLGTSSKAARGYDLAFGQAPKAVKAAKAAIRAEDSVEEAVAKLLRGCQHHLMANLAPAADGRDPDADPQLRIALRRLRTALAIVRKDVATSSLDVLDVEAGHLARILGVARNWDVFITETLVAAGEAGPPHLDLASLRE